jgi:hypothetical protein
LPSEDTTPPVMKMKRAMNRYTIVILVAKVGALALGSKSGISQALYSGQYSL